MIDDDGMTHNTHDFKFSIARCRNRNGRGRCAGIMAKRVLRMLVAFAVIAWAVLNVSCRGTFFIARADAPSGDPNAGDYHLAGVVLDALGRPVNGVNLTITVTVRYYGKSRDGEVPPFFTGNEKEVRTADGEFAVEEANAVGVSLLFEKDGFAPVSLHFATYEERGAPVIHNKLRVIMRSPNPSTHANGTAAVAQNPPSP